MDKRNKIILTTAVLVIFMGLGFITGFLAGTSIIIPNDININIDNEGKLEMFSEGMNNFTDSFAEAIHNQTCNFNVTMGEEFYMYAINSFKAVQKERKKNIKVVQTFCKLPNKIGTLHLREGKDLYMFELNKENKLGDYYFEIIGANIDKSEIVLSINGARTNIGRGDQISDGNMTVTLVEEFIVNIPYLDATGLFDINFR